MVIQYVQMFDRALRRSVVAAEDERRRKLRPSSAEPSRFKAAILATRAKLRAVATVAEFIPNDAGPRNHNGAGGSVVRVRRCARLGVETLLLVRFTPSIVY